MNVGRLQVKIVKRMEMSRQARRSGGLPKASLQPPEPVCSRTDIEARAQGRSDFGRGDDAGEHPVPLPRLHTQLPLTGVTASELPPIKLTHRDLRSIPSLPFLQTPTPTDPRLLHPANFHRTETKISKATTRAGLDPPTIPHPPRTIHPPVQLPGTPPVSTPNNPHPPRDYPPGDLPPTSTSSKCHP